MLLGEQGMILKHVPACIKIIQFNVPTDLEHISLYTTKENKKG